MAEELNARDAKLVQYLNEAYGKEQELIQSLEAHIPMANEEKTYKKRLQEHLRETKRHAKDVERRIKQLGGKVAPVDLPGPDVVADAATAGVAAVNRGVALVKGQAHAIRGTGYQEKLLKNAKTEYWNEFEEIATYYAIETLADLVGDKDTHKLARSIRKEEERMAKFLERQIPKLARAVGRDEIPAALRNGGSRRKKSSSSRSSASSRRSSSTSSRKSGGSSGSASTRAKSTAKSATKSARTATKSTAKSARSTAKSGAKSARSTAKSGAKSARSTAKSGAKSARSNAKTARTAASAASTSAKRSRAGAKGGSKSKGSSNGRSGSSRAKSGSRS